MSAMVAVGMGFYLISVCCFRLVCFFGSSCFIRLLLVCCLFVVLCFVVFCVCGCCCVLSCVVVVCVGAVLFVVCSVVF